MLRKLVVLSGLILALATGAAARAPSQCTNQITMVPLSAMKAASKPRDFIRFKYALSSADSLLVRSHEDTETSIGPYDVGFLIARNGITMRSVSLRRLPEIQREDSFFADSFTTIAISRACGGNGPVYFVTMKYMGDELSPALVFVVYTTAQGYVVVPLPMFSGGTVDVSKADPLRLRVWNNLNEGMCNACKTAYQITEYDIRDGQPVPVRRYRTRHLYKSDQFSESRIRFTP